MRGACLIVILACGTKQLGAQIIEIQRNVPKPSPGQPQPLEGGEQKSIELFSRGGLELTFQGPAQATTQLVRLRIGEPKGFNIPLYFFASAYGNALGGTDEPNEPVAASLLNPLGGTFNVGVNKTFPVLTTGDYTSIRIATQWSGKVLSGEKLGGSGDHALVVTGYGDAGLFFTTAAWQEKPSDEQRQDPNWKPSDLGVFWIQLKVAGHMGSKEKFVELFGNDLDGAFAGYSVDAGIDIQQFLNIKVGIYQALKRGSVPVFKDPFFKLAFEFRGKKAEM